MSDAELQRQKSRAKVRKYRYGITEAEYNRLLNEQDYSCAVCHVAFGTGAAKVNVDHDHNCCPGTRSCGKCLRGLLCSHCITLSSLVETRFSYMEEMFVYLTTHLNGRRNK
jgi:hypothetical protein